MLLYTQTKKITALNSETCWEGADGGGFGCHHGLLRAVPCLVSLCAGLVHSPCVTMDVQSRHFQLPGSIATARDGTFVGTQGCKCSASDRTGSVSIAAVVLTAQQQEGSVRSRKGLVCAGQWAEAELLTQLLARCVTLGCTCYCSKLEFSHHKMQSISIREMGNS